MLTSEATLPTIQLYNRSIVLVFLIMYRGLARCPGP